MGLSVLTSSHTPVLPRVPLGVPPPVPSARASRIRQTPSGATSLSSPDATQFEGLHSHATLGLPGSSRRQSHAEAFSRAASSHLNRKGSQGPSSTGYNQNVGRRAVVSAVFERFTERAIRAIMAAQKEASVAKRKEVGTEQLLMGLVAIESRHGQQGSCFGMSGITPEGVKEAFQALLSEGVLLPSVDAALEKPAMEIPFSLGCKHVFEAALDESRKLKHNFISPEHLLVALLSVDMDGAFKLLNKMGVSRDQLKNDALARLRGQLADEGRSTANMPFPTPQAQGAGGAPPPAMAMSSSTSTLSKSAKNQEKNVFAEFCIDLTARAAEGLIDPVIGREKEVERVVQVLGRRRKNSPMLLGEPGVGKTAIAEGLAMRIHDKTVPEFLLEKKVMSLDLGLMLAGTKERGELEKRINTLISEAQKAGDIILVIDEIHTMIGMGAVSRGGAAGSGLDVANLLKPALSRGQLQCIGATTIREYRQHVEKDKALARRFQPVDVCEPSQEDAVTILMGLRSRYESFHQCRISDEAILAAVELSARYIPDRFLPDKAIDLIDEASSRARIDNFRRRRQRESSVLLGTPEEYWREIRAVQASQEAVLVKASSPLSSLTNLISSGLETAAAAAAAAAVPVPGLAPKENTGTGEGKKADFERRMQDYDKGLVLVNREDIAAVASQWSGVPLQQLTQDEKTQLVALEGALQKRVVGQDEAVGAISRAVRRARVGMKDPKRPIAALMFCGPTGVGKTELAKSLAASYFGTEEAMIRLDMSEYMERHSVSKLVGAPPGYVGYEEPGKLTEAVRRRPFSLVLFDEIEKAHPDFFNMLLQIFEDGRLTDSKGRVVDFKNTLIVMTSNVASATIARGGGARVGFTFGMDDEGSPDGGRYAALKELVNEELKGHFRPELLNRIDEIVVFRPLEKSQVRSIVEKMLQESVDRLSKRGIRLEVSEAVIAKVCDEGYDRSYGARPLRRAVSRLVEDPVSEAVLGEKEFAAGDTAMVNVDEEGNVVVSRLPMPDVCEHGFCMPLLKVAPPTPIIVGHPD